ncbi:MAG TPA: DUF58 domain-containing protein [Chromatiaceae bacterium]|nr:DUF58 domain-containing protein [Chromatiaceae bacterium]
MSTVPKSGNSAISVSLGELVALSNKARQLHLRPRVVRARQGGQYISRMRGRGMEFDESRLYQPGDDVRNIDWRVTARTGKTHSKVFREERERPVLISVDARQPMFFATRGRFKWVQAARLAAQLAWTTHQAGDRLGGEIFSDDGFAEFRPRRGKQSVLRFVKTLADASMRQAEFAAGFSMEKIFRRLHRTAHPGSLVIFISDFRGFDEASERQLARIARHNDVLLLHVFDWLEASLPRKGHYRLGDGIRTLELDTGDANLQSSYQQQYQHRVARLKNLCRRLHMTWQQCATDDDPVAVLHDIFGKETVR